MEEEVLNQFKRQAHQYLTCIPNNSSNVEWLSLIQHHGGPTRLLDVTRSFYVAAYFAIEEARDEAVVWAVNQDILDTRLMDLTEQPECADHRPTVRSLALRLAERCISPTIPEALQDFGDAVDAMDPDDSRPDPVVGVPNVLVVRPWRLSQRMIIQQGWFLFPTDLSVTFEHNLASGLGVKMPRLPVRGMTRDEGLIRRMLDDQTRSVALIKFIFPHRKQAEVMRDLRKMNISSATLFPGLDGFARSLRISSDV